VGAAPLKQEKLDRKITKGEELFSSCRCCPRRCGVNRLKNEHGFCQTGAKAVVASTNSHHGEEPPISAWDGSGTVFFARCTMRCLFCQNYPISHFGVGHDVTPDELATIFIELQRRGCHNLNLVTASHVVLPILQALRGAYAKGFTLPIVWNSSGYESPECLDLLDGIVDLYLPDIKYRVPGLSRKYSDVTDYVDFNGPALLEMFRQVGFLTTDSHGVAVKGLIVRHLVLPGALENTRLCLEFVARELSPRVHVSLMGQYFPAFKAVGHPQMGRRLRADEYARAVALLDEFGLENGWSQSLEEVGKGGC